MWNEQIAKRGANEVASCLCDFFSKLVSKGISEINLWSDNCGGQNRNRIVYYMYLLAANIFKIKICHRVLEKGHTQNEGDSVHALIEKMARGREVYYTLFTNSNDTSLNENVYKILKSMLHPKLPKEKTYKEIEETLKLRFQVRTSHYRKRILFDNLKQDDEENVSKWYACIKEAAAECNFSQGVEERVKDKFVTGLKPGLLQDRLCEEPVSVCKKH
ncbi:unnamed protein product [Chilo suppressalis]|uniref:DUF4371 domain-containing protein n=1 Tax=Chilo suppressalis TaxID=168631 RepID=A0ABN8ASV8_CHISP|nr:unnamed protein product [Chilo suppressalis]